MGQEGAAIVPQAVGEAAVGEADSKENIFLKNPENTAFVRSQLSAPTTQS